MLRIAVQCGGRVRYFPVPAGEAVLGSSLEDDLVCRFPGVSRAHARIARRQTGVTVIDLGSKNGLVQGGRRLERMQLDVGESVRLGKAWLTLEEISTGDAVDWIGFEWRDDRPAAAVGDTASHTGTVYHDEGSPQAALRLTSELQQRRPWNLGEDQELVERAREAAGAVCLIVLQADAKRRVVVSRCCGMAPEPSELERLLTWVQAGAEGVLTLDESSWIGGWVAGGSGALCMRFESRPQPWQQDLVSFLLGGMVLSDRRRRGDRGGSKRRKPLRLPDGVVLGESPAVRQLLHEIESTLESRLDVLLLGETGVGKEVFARILHDSGPTAGEPFVAINCAAIPADLLEAQLFGIEQGVATGVSRRLGLFEEAGSGTLLLDEIGELSLQLQAKLLRVLEEREVLPVGALHPRRIGARVMAASNQSLTQLIEEGRFRLDLYYRLRGLELVVPPLRERREDIPALVVELVRAARRDDRKRVAGITPKALELLCDYPWPGNVRELKSAVRKAVAGCLSGGSLESSSFPDQLAWRSAARGSASEGLPRRFAGREPREADAFPSLAERVEATERLAVREALERSQNNKTQAAKLLGITRQALNGKLRRWRAKDGS